MPQKFLTTLPVFNEVKYVNEVLDLVKKYSPQVLVVDDGSTDGTTELLAQRNDVIVIQHQQNSGYGAALNTAFDYAIEHEYDTVVTIDCDGQHEPQRIPEFVEACADGVGVGPLPGAAGGGPATTVAETDQVVGDHPLSDSARNDVG
ncbi:MAG: glycosyltransferase family 2 protein, partial [Pirellulales bacterium]|nr:glycosyltransferase family 2 protein [Pirellulales bacterium]